MEQIEKFKGVFEEVNQDIKKIFLLYGLCCKKTGVTAFRDGYVNIDRFYNEFQENLILKFPEITQSEFKELYDEIMKILNNNNINLIEDLWQNTEQGIFEQYKALISNFVLNF